MAEIRATASAEEPVDQPEVAHQVEGEAAQTPAAVDMPEANFKPASPITV